MKPTIKIIPMPPPAQRGKMSKALSDLKIKTNSCLILETAQEWRHFVGTSSHLSRKGMKFKTANGPNGTVNVWRIK